jgi:hypothetical protein
MHAYLKFKQLYYVSFFDNKNFKAKNNCFCFATMRESSEKVAVIN